MAQIHLLLLFGFVIVHGEFSQDNRPNSLETYQKETNYVLGYLNAAPFQAYNYNSARLVNAQKKADIVELLLDVDVSCNGNYPEIPCDDDVLSCSAFVRGWQILGDVKCVPKLRIVVEDSSPVSGSYQVLDYPQEKQSIVLSNEAVSSEGGGSADFVAVRRDKAPCTGCPYDLDPSVAGVDELVNVALKHVESERQDKQSLVKVLSLQQQVVSGIKYILLIEIAPHGCQQTSETSQKQECHSEVCKIEYIQKPWIELTKHVVSNNCTRSQEYLANEIPTTATNDHIPPRTTNADWLSDLESQIIVDATPDTEIHEVDHPVVLSTVATQPILFHPTQEQFPSTPLEDSPSNIQNTEAGTDQNESKSSSEESSEEKGEKLRKLRNEIGNGSEENSSESKSSQSSSEESSEENDVKTKKSESDEKKDSKSDERKPRQRRHFIIVDTSEDSKSLSTSISSEEKHRAKRAVRQLEKIAPDEKNLVSNLADYVASAMDKIDDDENKRIILQIVKAKKTPALDGTYYHLILRMGVSRCLEDKFDANCHEKMIDDYVKICKVQVHVQPDQTNPKIVKSQCQNTKRDKNLKNRTNYSRYRREIVAGGLNPIDANDTKVFSLIQQSLQHLDAQSSGENKLKPVEIISASSQVVAGVLYRIRVKFAESDCKKTEGKDVASCGLSGNSEEKICDIEVWEKPWLKNQKFEINCPKDEKYQFEKTQRRKRSNLLGGEQSGDKNAPEILEYLESGLQHLDSQSSHTNVYKIEDVLQVTKQVVSGLLYRIKAKIALSDCAKNQLIERQKCGKLQGGEETTCDFKIWDQAWLPEGRETNITCENDSKQYTFRTRRRKRSINSNLLGRDDHDFQYNEFMSFVQKYNKTYDSKDEKMRRFKVFSKNMKVVRMLNTYERGTAIYGATFHADWTRKEFEQLLGLREDLRDVNALPLPLAQIPEIDPPEQFDWRSKNAVTPVKNQGSCGSCWAFSVTGNVEGQYAIKYGKLLEFSEQELVDCDHTDQGCNGGLMDEAYRQIEKIGGLETEQDYPYDGADEKCHFNTAKVEVRLSDAVNISQDEGDIAKWLVKNGPISIGINANAMQFYVGGVSHPFKFLCNPNSLDHGVLIVGYGTHTYPKFNKTLPYWIVKNSWGPRWGEQGYYRVYRGDGTCGLNKTPTSAVIV